jgi:hypothetical protein
VSGFFPPSTSVFPYKFHSTAFSINWETEKKLILFFTGLHNKPQGCSTSVASAAGPFAKERIEINLRREVKYITETTFAKFMLL